MCFIYPRMLTFTLMIYPSVPALCPSAYIKRVIAHPNFHNISFNQAEKMMETLDQGDLIIRPSSKGENHLTVTWKVRGWRYSRMGMYQCGWDEIKKVI